MIIEFPMKIRIGAIQATMALNILEEVMEDIEDEELRGDLIVQAHDIILDFINDSDPTNEEVEEFARSFEQDVSGVFTITFDRDFDNDN